MATNPRSKNGTLRRKHRQRFKAMQAPCGICGGRLGPIDYESPSDSNHPLSFVIDEVIPISKWEQYGYSSAAAAAQDWDNLQPAHYICNQLKRDRVGYTLASSDGGKNLEKQRKRKQIALDGEW